MTQPDERPTMVSTGRDLFGQWFLIVLDHTLPLIGEGVLARRDYQTYVWPKGHGAPTTALREAALMELGWERIEDERWEYSEIPDNAHPADANWGLLTRVARLAVPAPVNVDGEDLDDTTGMHLIGEEVAA